MTGERTCGTQCSSVGQACSTAAGGSRRGWSPGPIRVCGEPNAKPNAPVGVTICPAYSTPFSSRMVSKKGLSPTLPAKDCGEIGLTGLPGDEAGVLHREGELQSALGDLLGGGSGLEATVGTGPSRIKDFNEPMICSPSRRRRCNPGSSVKPQRWITGCTLPSPSALDDNRQRDGRRDRGAVQSTHQPEKPMPRRPIVPLKRRQATAAVENTTTPQTASHAPDLTKGSMERNGGRITATQSTSSIRSSIHRNGSNRMTRKA